jgi:hypothetical protein
MHLKTYCYLAQGGGTGPTVNELTGGARIKSPFHTETVLILGLAVLVGLSFFAWAFFFRKRRPADPHRQVIEAGSTDDQGEPTKGDRHHHHGHRRRHHRHRHTSHTHRNPTLQETGGLPPLRPEDQPPPV